MTELFYNGSHISKAMKEPVSFSDFNQQGCLAMTESKRIDEKLNFHSEADVWDLD